MGDITLSKITKSYLSILGEMIHSTRVKQSITQTELAERINCSRQTIAKIEQGNATVTIGAYFEATYILGIPLFVENESDLSKLSSDLNNISELLPSRVRKKIIKIDNDF